MAWGDNEGFPGGKDPGEIFSEMKRKLPRQLPGGLLAVAVVVALAAWAATGFYIVNPDELGVVKRFGAFVGTTGSGPHWHLPFPIETVMKPKVTQVRRLEIGFRTVTAGPPARYQKVPAEALMLTGDENIVSCEFIVQYRVRDPQAFLFNVRGTEEAVRDGAEAAMREVVGRHTVDDVLTEQKEKIQVESVEELQGILDSYGAGIRVDYVKLQDVYPPAQVIDAFRDVASAREDRERVKNEAEAYANDILPKARGEAKKLVNEAQAYQATKVQRAKGDANRFEALRAEYAQAKDVTRRRLYLEAMTDVLGRAKVVLAGQKSGGVLPLLSIDRFGAGEGK